MVSKDISFVYNLTNILFEIVSLPFFCNSTSKDISTADNQWQDSEKYTTKHLNLEVF